MIAPGLADTELGRRRAKNAERMRRWRAGGAKAERTRRQNHGDDIGPAIDPGDPFKDDLDRCEAKWREVMAGARFEDRRMLTL